MAFNFNSSAPKSATPSFGGLSSSTTQPFNFGATTSQPSAFSFGTTTTTNSQPTGFSFGAPASAGTGLGFGAPAPATGIPFGTATTSATTGLGFGTSTPTTGFSFGNTAAAPGGFGATSSTPSFPFTTPASTGLSFGSGLQTTSSSGFGSLGFGNTQTGSSLGGFGLGGNVAANNAQLSSSEVDIANMATALSKPFIYNDERDMIIAKWNRIQAFWGFGQGFYSSSAPPINFTPENPFCRFKAIGYSCIPKCKNEDGLVGLVFNKKESEVRSNQQQLVDSIHKILQSKPSLSVCVEGVKPLLDDKTEVIIFIMERAANGTSSRIPSTDFFNFANQTNNRNQFNSLGVAEIIPKAAPSAEQLKSYLNSPPNGIDPLIWQQAKEDNPDSNNLIPVPMIGFAELKRRLNYQAQETKLHQGCLDLLANDVTNLQKKHSAIVASLEDRKRKQLELSHRVLKVMVRQEICRKLGFGIQNEEEQLRIQLEALYAELSAPTQFKGRLSELMSQIRMQSQELGPVRGSSNCNLESEMVQDLKSHLKQQQENLMYLRNIIVNSSEDLNLIADSLSKQPS